MNMALVQPAEEFVVCGHYVVSQTPHGEWNTFLYTATSLDGIGSLAFVELMAEREVSNDGTNLMPIAVAIGRCHPAETTNGGGGPVRTTNFPDLCVADLRPYAYFAQEETGNPMSSYTVCGYDEDYRGSSFTVEQAPGPWTAALDVDSYVRSTGHDWFHTGTHPGVVEVVPCGDFADPASRTLEMMRMTAREIWCVKD